MAQYDTIALDYQKISAAVPLRDAEWYSLRVRLGDLTGLSVLDLACCDGMGTRLQPPQPVFDQRKYGFSFRLMDETLHEGARLRGTLFLGEKTVSSGAKSGSLGAKIGEDR